MSMYTGDLSLEDRRTFWRAYESLSALFGAEAIDTGLMSLRPTEVVEIYASPLDGPRYPGCGSYSGECFYKPQRELERGHEYVTFHNGDWEQHKRVPCRRYLVPYQYQGLSHGKVIRPALLSKFPWLEKFELKIYEFRGDGHNEIYVTTASDHRGHKALYVPYSALFAHDAEAIIERNRSYLEWYTKSSAAWESMKDDPVVVAFLKEVKK